MKQFRFKSPLASVLRSALCFGLVSVGSLQAVQAQEKFTYMTNWYAQAEHGGFYQAVATGIYKKYGLDVTVKMGGPQVNIVQLMAADQADCVMGSSDLQMIQVREGGVPCHHFGRRVSKRSSSADCT